MNIYDWTSCVVMYYAHPLAQRGVSKALTNKNGGIIFKTDTKTLQPSHFMLYISRLFNLKKYR